MEESIETILRQIRTDLRLSMDGVVAASMRAKGIDYRMNFGVKIPQIREISTRYKTGKALAELLWKEPVRELKILATMLYPAKEMDQDTAIRWAKGIENHELREQSCRNLFQEVPFADALVVDWIQYPDEKVRNTGYWLYARLCMVYPETVKTISGAMLLEHALQDLKSDSLLLRQSALNALKFMGRMSEGYAERVLQGIESLQEINNEMKSEMIDLLRFEFGYMD